MQYESVALKQRERKFGDSERILKFKNSLTVPEFFCAYSNLRRVQTINISLIFLFNGRTADFQGGRQLAFIDRKIPI